MVMGRWSVSVVTSGVHCWSITPCFMVLLRSYTQPLGTFRDLTENTAQSYAWFMHHILLIFEANSLWTLIHSVSSGYRMKVLGVAQVNATFPEDAICLTTRLLSFSSNNNDSSTRVIILSGAPNRLGGLRSSSVLCGRLEGNRMLLLLVLAGLALVSLLKLICGFRVLAPLQQLTWACICTWRLGVHHLLYIVDGLWRRTRLVTHGVKCVFFICVCCRATHSITMCMMIVRMCLCLFVCLCVY